MLVQPLRKVFFGLTFGSILLLAFQNCDKSSGNFSDQPSSGISFAADDQDQSTSNLTINPSTNFICSPFAVGTATAEKSGVKAQLSYKSAAFDANLYERSVLNYFPDSTGYLNPGFTLSSLPIYLNDINIPTRVFNQGFTAADGSLIKVNGQVLDEYFGLKMETVLKLGSGDREGVYELGSISDDGAIVIAHIDGQDIELVNNDGAHSTRMSCARQYLTLTHASRIPITVYYYQGPATEIANVLMWNYLGTDEGHLSPSRDHDGFCGAESIKNFWNPYVTDSGGTYHTELGPYVLNAVDHSGLLDPSSLGGKGWSILTSENFLLPNNESNPCAFQDVENTIQSVIDLSTDQDIAQGIRVLRLSLSDTLKSSHDIQTASISVRLYQPNDSSLPPQVQILNNGEGEAPFQLRIPNEEQHYQLEVTVTTGAVQMRKTFDLIIQLDDPPSLL